MPTDDRKDGTGEAFLGFENYADGTPRRPGAPPGREPEPRSWDASDRWREPLPPRPAEIVEPDAERRRNVWPKVGVGAAVLAAFGGGFLLAQSDAPPPPTAQRPATEAAAMAAAQPMNLEVAQPTPIPIPPVSRTGKLEVLPASPAPVASPAPPTLPSVPRETPVLPLAPAPRELAEAAPPQDAAVVAPERAPFDCGDASTPARAMVCRDPGLAAMDQRMKRAYAAALASGVPEGDLAADQDDWLAIREEAARYSRRSVANIYRQRIDELEAMGDRDW